MADEFDPRLPHPARPVSPSASPLHPASAAQRLTNLLHRRRKSALALASLVPVFGAVAAFGVAHDTPVPRAREVAEELAAPDMHAQLEALADNGGVFVNEERIRRGDTIATLLSRLGVADREAERFILNDPSARTLRQLKPGRSILAQTDADGELVALRYVFNETDGKDPTAGRRSRSFVVERHDDRLSAHDETFANERRVEMRSGEIRTSLFAATDAADVPDSVATQLTEIFSGDIDFYRDLRRGDRFRIVYEGFYQNGEFVRAGRVLAVDFVSGGKSHSAMWYGGANADDASIAGHYYGFDGRSLRRAFLRSPLEFTRISSGFGGRMHPIMNTWRQHTGVDYAAPSGTPVRTTADGVVDFVGQKNGYGNVVVIRHQGTYSTLYGHLSRFGAIKRGQRIEQGQLIGYVGMTGWATGPHLHYEFRIADHATNPLTAVLPDAPPIGRNEMTTFKVAAAAFDRQFQLLRWTEPGSGSNVPAVGESSEARVAAPMTGE